MFGDSKAVFLSYASEDSESAARIADALTAAGIEVWFDKSELRGGDVWDQKIRRRIQDCALFIPLISAATEARLEGYFRREWKCAADRTLDMADEKAFLVPVVIDDTLERDARVPEKFRQVQWSRLLGNAATPDFVSRVKSLLVDAPGSISRHRDVSVDAKLPLSQVTSERIGSRSRVFVTGGVAVCLAIVAGYFVYGRIGRQDAPQTAGTEAAVESIAVLPFADLSEKHDQEYFADGMAEEILDLLVKVPGLKVIGRTSSFQFKGKTDDFRKIGTMLGAKYVVEGSVRRSGDHLRVTAQLIDTRDGAHRWSETFDRNAIDVLQIQNDIALGLTRALQIELTGWDSSRPSPKSLEAYDSFLRALHARERYDRVGMEEAIADFKHSLELDPQLVSAAEQLAVTYWDMSAWGFILPGPGYREARATAEQALALSPNSAIAHAVLCELHTKYDWDWAAATRECNFARHFSPHSSYVLINAADLQLALANWDAASELIEAARAADPLDPRALETTGNVYMRAGRRADAEKAFRRLISVAPTYVYGHCLLAIALVDSGHAEEALAEANKETETMERALCLAISNHALKRPQPRDHALAELEEAARELWPMSVAEAHAFAGNKDRAFEWLQRAYEERDSTLYWIKGDPLLRNLESDPRYRTFLAKLNLPK